MCKDRKMRCEVCIKEIVFGYVNPDKDYTLCEACAFRDDEHSTYYEKIYKNNKENKTMKVKELIEVLKTLNPDSEVLINTWWETVIQDEGTVATKTLEFNDNYFYIDEDGNFVIDALLDDEQEENKIDYYRRC